MSKHQDRQRPDTVKHYTPDAPSMAALQAAERRALLVRLVKQALASRAQRDTPTGKR